jgi:hypothetical protein
MGGNCVKTQTASPQIGQDIKKENIVTQESQGSKTVISGVELKRSASGKITEASLR